VTADEKWFWKMIWCKQQGVDPANPYFWDKAEAALNNYLKSL
jgi:hypothetical protein